VSEGGVLRGFLLTVLVLVRRGFGVEYDFFDCAGKNVRSFVLLRPVSFSSAESRR